MTEDANGGQRRADVERRRPVDPVDEDVDRTTVDRTTIEGIVERLGPGEYVTDDTTDEATDSTYQALVTQRLADIDRILERMKRDQEDIQQLKTETRTILARLRAV
jgi:hypothetical protein